MTLQLWRQHIPWELLISLRNAVKSRTKFQQFFLMQKTVYDFVIFHHQSLDPFLHCQLFVCTQPHRAACSAGCFSAQCHAQGAAWVHDSPGQPGGTLYQNEHVSIQVKSFTNTAWHQISNRNLYLCLSCPRRSSGRIYLSLCDPLFPRDNIQEKTPLSPFIILWS